MQGKITKNSWNHFPHISYIDVFWGFFSFVLGPWFVHAEKVSTDSTLGTSPATILDFCAIWSLLPWWKQNSKSTWQRDRNLNHDDEKSSDRTRIYVSWINETKWNKCVYIYIYVYIYMYTYNKHKHCIKRTVSLFPYSFHIGWIKSPVIPLSLLACYLEDIPSIHQRVWSSSLNFGAIYTLSETNSTHLKKMSYFEGKTHLQPLLFQLPNLNFPEYKSKLGVGDPNS